MKRKSVAALVALALAALTLSAALSASPNPHENAIKACKVANLYQPVEFVTAIDNGSGYTLVWLTDADVNLWICLADNNGKIYAYEVVSGDLLRGTGPSLIGVELTSSESNQRPDEIAQKACIMAAKNGPAKVVASHPDGLFGDWTSGYSVFIQDSAGDFYLCNATGDAAIWTWASLFLPPSFDSAAVT